MAFLAAQPPNRQPDFRRTETGTMKRAIVIAIVVLVLIAGGLVGFRMISPRQQAGPPGAADLETVTVELGTIISSIKATGSLEPREDASLSFEINGTVAEVMVERGDVVQAGDELAQLDTTDLELAVSQARIDLEKAETQLVQAREEADEDDITSAQAALDSAQASYQALLEGSSEDDIASAQAALDSAQASYQALLEGSSEEEVTVAAANLRTAEIDLKQAQRDYDKVAYADTVGESPQAAALEQATIAYESALANYRLAVEDPGDEELRAAEAQIAQAQATLSDLIDSPSAEELRAAEAQIAQAQATLNNLLEGPSEEDIALAQANVEAAQLSLQRAEKDLERATLVARFNGTITAVNVGVGERLELAGVIDLADLTELHIDVPVDEIDLLAVQVGQRATVVLDAMPNAPIPGQVTAIAPAPIADDSSVTTYEVTITLEEQNPEAVVGMTANVDVETERHEDVMVIPAEVIQVDETTGHVYVLKLSAGGRPAKTEVTLGLRDGSTIEVLDGLEAGDRLLVPLSEETMAEESGGGGLFGGMRPPSGGHPGSGDMRPPQ
jgi:HlyD family secretion protein